MKMSHKIELEANGPQHSPEYTAIAHCWGLNIFEHLAFQLPSKPIKINYLNKNNHMAGKRTTPEIL